MATAVIGRGAELAALEAFVRELPSGPRVLVLEGEAGIGKTALWRAGIDEAMRRSYRVLTCGPAEAEASLSFAALGDLVGNVLADVLPALPPPRRRALEVALLLDDPGANPPDQRALDVGFLDVLRLFADESPVLVAVDDLQWLDVPSLQLLNFAFRRLRREPIRLLATMRRGAASSIAELVRATENDHLERLHVGPLNVGAIFQLLRLRLDLTLSRPTLVRLHEASAGNPFFALELGRELQRRGGSPGEPIPIPDDLHDLLRARLQRLRPQTRQVLLAAAALSQPSFDVLAAYAGEAAIGEAVEEAQSANIARFEGARLRFDHPLLASVCYGDFSPQERRAVHRQLAQVAIDVEERARHLALASSGADEEVAAAAESAAERAASRGAPSAAVELAELAIGLTPDPTGSEGRRRRLRAADWHWLAGSFDRAEQLLDELLADAAAGPERAEVLLRVASLREADDLVAMIELGQQALAEARGDRRLEAEIHFLLAKAWHIRGETGRALEHARAGAAAAEDGADEPLLVRQLANVARLETSTGDVTSGLLERAVALEDALDVPLPFDESPGALMGRRALHLGELAEARALLERAHARTIQQGHEVSRASSLFTLGELEYQAGNWSLAYGHAEAGVELARQLGVPQTLSSTLYVKGLVTASLGRVSEARASACEGIRLADDVADSVMAVAHRGILGFVELSAGNLDAAARQLGPLPERMARRAAPSLVWWNAIEALIGVGDLERAGVYLAEFSERARKSGSPRFLGPAHRCLALLHAAEGDLGEALAALDAALTEHARSPIGPFERARTLLALGATQRRARQQRLARQDLQRALEVFEQLPAPLWADKARAQLARLGGRRPSAELTGTEQRVAELVAEGRSNKQVASALFVTVHTVEAHLSRIYRKLGVHSRTELAHRLNESSGAKV